MKGIFSVFAASVFLLAGCEPATVSAVSDVQYASKDATLELNRIQLPDGSEISSVGRLFQYQFLQNERGEFDRYTIHSNDSLMSVEGSVFAQLAKAGYARRVRAETPGRFVVNYIKKGIAPVTATYTVHTVKAEGSAVKSQVIFTWKAAG